MKAKIPGTLSQFRTQARTRRTTHTVYRQRTRRHTHEREERRADRSAAAALPRVQPRQGAHEFARSLGHALPELHWCERAPNAHSVRVRIGADQTKMPQCSWEEGPDGFTILSESSADAPL